MTASLLPITNCLLKHCLPVILWLSTTIPSTLQATEGVKISRGENDTVNITIDGQPFSTYNFGKSLPKPFMLPVRTASGTIITRALNDSSDPDHPHHKGLWVSVDEVNLQKHWAEKAPIVNVNVSITSLKNGAEMLQVTNEWQNAETRIAEVIETTKITVYPNRLLVYDITFTTSQNEAVFEDTKEGLLGFRVAPSMKEKNGGHVVSSDGTQGTKACWGKSFAWIDYVGQADGKTAGVTLMDHPGNSRVSRYHVRDYGLFSMSPFGEKAYTNADQDARPLHLKAGESFRLKYGVFIHDGDTSEARVSQVYDQFLDVTK